IKPKLLGKDYIITSDYINAKQRLTNFAIKRKNLFLRLFTRTKRNTKNPIKKVNINYGYNFIKTY
ncbi:MAG: hypothetical protein ABSA84_07170, partial [Gammaproteobacteria bacterium]